jgi:hypothetical protein
MNTRLSKIKIEKGVPLPDPNIEPLMTMVVGDSFVLNMQNQVARAWVNYRTKKHQMKAVFTIRKLSDDPPRVRVWRIS